ncbi:MAG: AsmA family protein, partial [Candidatus Sulfotelmatobacter sp.]
LKARIANSISQAVARPTEVGSVNLRFLPRPGFDLENVVIYEDPAFGAEPMLRAPEVTAVVRLTSLLRGRLDISRLELTEPSLNLVRREDGRWNWEALLERTARTPLAPTAKSKREARPGFPYIEASSGRINFKAGAEKKPYALLNADFAVWQESENAWGVRLKAEPLRTDMSLSDAGLLRMNGTWQRAGSLRETPLQFTLAWERAQLGQMSKLVMGNDKGWRGEVEMKAALSGTPGAMQMAVDAAVRNFHRYDIPTSEGLGLAAHCEGKYSSAEGMIREIFCNAPVGDGMVTLRGNTGMPGSRRVDLVLNMENVPASAVAQLARRAKKDLPHDLVATGSVQGNFMMAEPGMSQRAAEFQGRGEIANFRLQSANSKAEIDADSVPFSITPDWASHESLKGRVVRRVDFERAPIGEEVRLEFGPFPVALGRPVAAQARGWLGRTGYEITVHGDGEVSRSLRVASLLGLQAVKANVEGAAQMDLEIGGTWAENESGNPAGFSLPKVVGTAQLHNVRALVRGLRGPVEISSAQLKLLPDEARVEKLKVRAADADWTGSVTLPRGCGMPGACVAHFDLNTSEVGLSGLHQWLVPQASERHWYQVLGPAQSGTAFFLQNLRASGKVNAVRLRIHDVVAERVSADIEVDRGKLKVSDLRADLLGGKHRGEWLADFTEATPAFSGSGTLTGISLGELASAMHDPWISGTGAGSYQLKTSGADATAIWQSAEGGVRFDVRDGILSHISLASDASPLQVARWQGWAGVHEGKIEIEKSELASSGGNYEISGTASFGRILDFKLIAGTETKAAGPLVYSITGTVAEPRVAVSATAEQARLKP